MAIEQVQNLPQQYVTDLGVDYGKQLAGLTAIPLDTARLAPQVAAQDALQTQAYNLAPISTKPPVFLKSFSIPPRSMIPPSALPIRPP